MRYNCTEHSLNGVSCLDARFSDGTPLSPIQKRGHITLLIQAGADTTGTAMGMTLQYILKNPHVLERVKAEIEAAESRGFLSTPVRYDEMKQHLPYMGACIKEGLRLGPPAPSLFARQIPKGGKVIDGHFIPGGSDVTVYSYTLQRNKEFYGDDAEEFKPERWLISQQRNFEMEAAQFTFGAGARVCLGKDVAILESHKLLPEVSSRSDTAPYFQILIETDYPPVRFRGQTVRSVYSYWRGGVQCWLNGEPYTEGMKLAGFKKSYPLFFLECLFPMRLCGFRKTWGG